MTTTSETLPDIVNDSQPEPSEQPSAPPSAFLDEEDEQDPLAKLLIIGDGKCGKTHFSAIAALAGFKVVYFDADVARATIMGRDFPAAARKNILLLDVADTLEGGARDSNFFDIMKEFSSVTTFRLNRTQRRVSSKKKDKAGDVIIEIKPARMDSNVIFVLDSWTSLVESITQAAGTAEGVDISDTAMSAMRPVYQSAGLKATQILQIIKAMRCHVIVICHPDEYSHTTKPEGKAVGKITEKDLIVDWTKMIPKSTSKPAAMQMAKYFTDIAWLTTNATGSERLLDCRISPERVSGGHWNERKNVDEYSFVNLIKHLGGAMPEGEVDTSHWLNVSVVPEGGVAPTLGAAKVLDGTKPSTAMQGGGMASLFKKA